MVTIPTPIRVRVQYSSDGGITWTTLPPSGVISGAPVTPRNPDAPQPPAPSWAPRNVTAGQSTTHPGTIDLTWGDPGAGAPDHYAYGRGGADSAGSGSWLSPLLPPTTRSATLDKLFPATTYQVFVRSYHGTTQTDTTLTITTPQVTAPTPPVTPAPGDTTTGEPLAGRSGLGYNSIRFDGGRPSLTTLNTAGLDRGRPFDGALWFITRNKGWEPYTDATQYGDTRTMLAAGMTIVTSLPHAPENLGTSINTLGAKDAFHDEQRKLGEFWATNGMNTPHHVIRPGWEFNGDWYNWSVAYGGTAAYRDAHAHLIDNIRAGGADQVRFDLCANIDSSTGATWAHVWPGDGYYSIVGIDQYDMWPPSFTQAAWDAKQAKVLSMAGAATFASAHGAQWALDEGGNAHGNNGGGDNPAYWAYQHATLELHKSNLAHHTTYDEAGTGGLDHTLNDNPKSKTAYITYYGGGAA